MSKDNVVQFPTKQEDVKKILDKQKKMIEKVDNKREKGLERFTERCQTFEDRPILTDETPFNENHLRGIENALKSSLLFSEGIDGLVNLIRIDSVQMIEDLHKQAVEMIQLSVYLQSMLEVLVEKELITKEEIAEKWEQISKNFQS